MPEKRNRRVDMTVYGFKKRVGLSFVLLAVVLIGTAFVFTPSLSAAATEASAESRNVAWVCFAAALAFGCGAFGAGMAISHVGSAAMGAISEKPEIATNALIFIALAEGLVVFGFITALMILGKV